MRKLVALAFFLSGASALIFETLWQNLAGLALGNSVWASSLVLASFMGGLALGNGLVARHGARVGSALRAYAVLEVLIAVSGLGLVLLFPLLNELLAPLFGALAETPLALNALRLIVAFALMLVPSVAMGATLPLLVQGLRGEGSFGSALGLLYGLNTLGAVAGALAGEFVLIERIGLVGSGCLAAGVNLVAAGLAVLVWRTEGAGTGFTPARDPGGQEDRTEDVGAGYSPAREPGGGKPRPYEGEPARARRILAAAFLAGLSLLALEVIWFRYLLLFTFGSTANFAVMLAVVLAGIGVGGAIAGRWTRRPDAHRHLALLALVASALVLGGYAAFPLGDELEHSWELGTGLGRAVRLTLPVSIVSGLLFTLLGQGLHRALGEASETRSAGWLTLANTTGAMLGALLGGFVLLPALGVEASLVLLALVYVGVAALVLPAGALVDGVVRKQLVPAGALVLLGFGLFPYGRMQETHGLIAGRFNGDVHIVESREALTETVLYLERRHMGEPCTYRLVTNGHSMSGTDVLAKRYMKFYVYLPVALHPAPRRALLISYGVGSTAKALTDTRELEHIDVVDISRDIVDLNRIVYPEEGTLPTADPRLTVHIEDGRFFLQTTDERYDLITGEPPPPKAAGIASLYSREQFQLIHDRLRPGGMATWWIPLDQLEEADHRAIVHAWCQVFGETSMWIGSGTQWMLLGVKPGGERVSAERFRAQWTDPVVGPELRALGFEEPEQFGALFVDDGPGLLELCAGTPPLVDDYPLRLSPRLPTLQSFEGAYAELLATGPARDRFRASAHVRTLWPPELLDASLPAFADRELINDCTLYRVDARGYRLAILHQVLSETKLETLPLWILGGNADLQRIAARLHAAGSRDPEVLSRLGDGALARRDPAAAAAHYAAALKGRPDWTRVQQLHAYALFAAGERAAAREQLAALAGGEETLRFKRFVQEAFGSD